jgi:hypothetical protein
MTAAVVKVTEQGETVWFPSVSALVAERVVRQFNKFCPNEGRLFKLVYHII